MPNFYITSSTPQIELSPTCQKDVITTKGCSNCAKLEQELATYKNEYFPFMLPVKNLMFWIFRRANSTYGVGEVKEQTKSGVGLIMFLQQHMTLGSKWSVWPVGILEFFVEILNDCLYFK